MAELEVHVVDQDSIVNLPGTRCTITFQRASDLPGIVEKPEWTRNDSDAGIEPVSFSRPGISGSTNKARELGWIEYAGAIRTL